MPTTDTINNNLSRNSSPKSIYEKDADNKDGDNGRSKVVEQHSPAQKQLKRLLSSGASSSSSLDVLLNDVNDTSSTNLKYTSTSLTDFFIRNQIKPTTTSILRPGARFKGSQESARTTYEVEVELKFVDLTKSYLCGFLKIIGLTESHPQIITFFESEIVSENYSFFTEREEWGATDKIDIQHWLKFYSWNTLPVKKILDKTYVHKDFLSHDNLYMRWKEKFLVPDHKVESIEGASFAGFYYICFNQKTGNILGLYFHKSSEKFQQLELSYVPSNGIGATYQFQ